jgi:urease accessory protein
MYAAMLLADARLPSGGHAYSAGVEPALRSGLAPEEIGEYMLGRARTVVRVEAGTAVVARHAFLDDADSHAGLDAVLAAWAARTPSPALREASAAQARGLLRLAVSLWPGPMWPVLAEQARPLSRAVVLGAIAAASGMSAVELVRTVVYDDAATAAAALLKLDPCDPAQVSRWVLDACAAAEPFVVDLASLTEPAAIPAAGAPQSEEWAQAHALLTQRLFRA